MFLILPWKLFRGGVRFKNFFGPSYEDNQLSFLKYSPILLFLIQPLLGPLLQFFGPAGLFWFFGTTFRMGSGSKTLFEPTNVDYPFLLWKCNSIFFVSNLVFRVVFRVEVRLKNVLRPIYVDNQLWFWKYNLIIYYQFGYILGFFCPFLLPSGGFFCPFGAIFWVGIRFKIFLEPTNVENRFLLWKVFGKIGGLFCTFWTLWGYFFG